MENLSPQIIRQIAKELADLTKEPLEGIKIFPNEADITDIRASIEGPGINLSACHAVSNAIACFIVLHVQSCIHFKH